MKGFILSRMLNIQYGGWKYFDRITHDTQII
jgi:hypothetical protein